jgi:flagellar hook protein FlgE
VLSDPTTYNNATSLTVYDAKGQDVALTYYFQKAGTDQWNVYATANGASVLADASGVPQPVTTIQFPPNGGKPTSPAGPVNLDIPASTNAQGAQTLAINGIQFSVTGATQYGAAFGVTDQTQNGYAPGQLAGIAIEPSGVVTARYSNGQSKPAGQIEIASFATRRACNRWAATTGRAPSLRAIRWSARRAAATSACCSPARSKRATSISPPSWST